MNYTFDYVTRAGIEIEITLPLGSDGRILSERYMTDSERRKLTAIRLQAEANEYTLSDPTIH